MSDVSAIKIEAELLQQGNSGGTDAIMATIGGVMVEEYDKLLNSYNTELIGINNEKSSVRQNRDNFSIAAGEGDAYIPVEGEENEGIRGFVYTAEQLEDLVGLAKEYGVTINATRSAEGNFVSEQTIQDVKDKMDSRLQDLNSNSEIKMINFQSLMDARKQSMMMLSNMINSDSTTKMSIIQNLRS